jgi:hypothetical protein
LLFFDENTILLFFDGKTILLLLMVVTRFDSCECQLLRTLLAFSI